LAIVICVFSFTKQINSIGIQRKSYDVFCK
jgi:hypothetical protein